LALFEEAEEEEEGDLDLGPRQKKIPPKTCRVIKHMEITPARRTAGQCVCVCVCAGREEGSVQS